MEIGQRTKERKIKRTRVQFVRYSDIFFLPFSYRTKTADQLRDKMCTKLTCQCFLKFCT